MKASKQKIIESQPRFTIAYYAKEEKENKSSAMEPSGSSQMTEIENPKEITIQLNETAAVSKGERKIYIFFIFIVQNIGTKPFS